jgi:hypothetical protein
MRLGAFVCVFAILSAAEIQGVHSVYFFPMRSGLDQYLANRLTNDHVFQVVSDPKMADALFTDQLGEAFEYKLDHMHSAPRPVKKDDNTAQQDQPPIVSSLGRGRGTIFLVDAKSKQVLWSIYEKPKNSSAEQLDKTARRIVEHLRKDLGGGSRNGQAKTLTPPS